MSGRITPTRPWPACVTLVSWDIAEKLLLKEETLSVPPLGVLEDDDDDGAAVVVVGAVVFFELLHAVPTKPRATRRERPPANVLLLFNKPFLPCDAPSLGSL